MYQTIDKIDHVGYENRRNESLKGNYFEVSWDIAVRWTTNQAVLVQALARVTV